MLCYLQGLSTQAAAQRLGCPQGTVLSRLSRAREQLRKRLTRRGLTVPAGLLAAGLATETARAAVPPALARVVIQAAVAATLHQAAGSAAISASAVQLTRGVLRTMFFTKLKMAAAVHRHGRRPGDRCGSLRSRTYRNPGPASDRGRKGPGGSITTPERPEKIPRAPR